MKKRIFSILLSICMVVTMIPVAATAVHAASALPISVRVNGLNMLERQYYSNSTSNHIGNNFKYDASYNRNTNTLTLAKDARIDGVISVNYETRGASNNVPLTVRFKGNNTLYSEGGNGNIAVGAGLIIAGEGTLTAECHSNMAEGSIYAKGDITIDSGNITVIQDNAYDSGIKASGGDITISGAGTTVNVTNSSNRTIQEYKPYAVEAGGDITVSGGAVLTASQTAESDVQAIVGTVKTDETGTIIAGKTASDAAAVSAADFNTNRSQYKYVKVKTAVPHNHCICGASHQAVGNHTDEKKVKFTAWDDEEASNQFAAYKNKTAVNALPRTAGNYYLEGDVCLDEAWDAPTGVVLCLNGHKITTKSGAEYKVDHGRNTALIGVINKESLTVTDCKVSGSITNEGQVKNTKGVVVKWYDNSARSTSFNMYGITIEGFTDSGVCTDYTNSNFNMYSGTITGNTAQNGGGVNAHNGTFTMYGGIITGNTATENGGGVYNGFKIGEKATVTGNYKGTGEDKTANNVYLPLYQRIGITAKSSTASRVGVTTETTPKKEDGSDAVEIAGPAMRENVTDLEAFKDCFVSDADSEHIKPVYGVNDYNEKIIKLVRNPLPEQSGFKFAEAEVNKTYGDEPFTKTAEGNIGGTVTYTSDNPDVATVDNNGTVTVKGAGEATITATVSRTDEYAETSASYKLIVDRKPVDAPAADTTEFVYDGNAKTYTLEENEAYTVTGNVQTNAGRYTVTVSLKDADKYRWLDGTATDKTYDFVINKAGVAKPELTKNTFEYSGEDIVPAVTYSKDKVTLDGNTSAKNTGDYNITVSLNDKGNYKWENSDNGDDINLSWSIAKAKLTVQPENVTIKQGDKLPTDMKLVFRGFKGEDNEESSITGPISDDDFEFLNEDGTALADTDTQGTYRIKFKNEAVLSSDNYDFEYVEGVLTVEKKTSGTYKPTQKPEIIAGEGVKAELRINGTKATITVEAGYEITDVLVNGVSIGKVTEITGLKTGDKVEIKTAKKQTEPEFNVKNYVKELTLAARSSKTAKGNIRIKVASVADENGNPVDLSELKAKGYTVKYKFYRSEKKAAEYGARIEKDTDNNSYINNTGKKGAKYFYKVRVMVYDANGKLVAKSELKQCKYASRIWSK